MLNPTMKLIRAGRARGRNARRSRWSARRRSAPPQRILATGAAQQFRQSNTRRRGGERQHLEAVAGSSPTFSTSAVATPSGNWSFWSRISVRRRRHREQHAEQAAQARNRKHPPVIEPRPVPHDHECRNREDRAGRDGCRAEAPAVATMLFSRMLERPMSFSTPIEMTAAGIAVARAPRRARGRRSRRRAALRRISERTMARTVNCAGSCELFIGSTTHSRGRGSVRPATASSSGWKYSTIAVASICRRASASQCVLPGLAATEREHFLEAAAGFFELPDRATRRAAGP